MWEQAVPEGQELDSSALAHLWQKLQARRTRTFREDSCTLYLVFSGNDNFSVRKGILGYR